MSLRQLSLVLAFSLLAGCGGGREVSRDDRQAIEAVLRAYADSMAAAYQAGDAAGIAPLATEREQQRLAISIRELAEEGRALRPVLKSFVVESIERAGNASVAANTLEIWDLRVVAIGTEQQVSESLDQENRLTYSLVRDKGKWRVLSRQLRSSSAS